MSQEGLQKMGGKIEGGTEIDLSRIEKAKIEVASMLHDNWRASRKKEDGTYEPRVKDDGRGGQVDIANTVYIDLPQNWQAENRNAAEVVVDLVFEGITANEDIHSTEFLETTADKAHQAWMERNPKQDYNAAQHVPYSELPEDEKQKDRDQVSAAIQALGR